VVEKAEYQALILAEKSRSEEQVMELFISHSSKDTAIAVALIDLLRHALNMSSSQIRCTSVNGYRLLAGAPTEVTLREEVHKAAAFIGLITPASIKSPYVLFELGARWGAKRHLVPLLASGANTSLLGPLTNLNALSCDDAGQVDQLILDLGSVLERKCDKPASYLTYVDVLVQASQKRK
jgi:hypothetical protein